MLNNPINRNDPTGRSDVPYSDLIQMAIDFFSQTANGAWQVVGNPLEKSQYANGADLVFTRNANNAIEALCVEVKDVARNVSLGTLGKSAKFNDYGGEVARIVRSADRFKTSSVEQLRLESNTIINNSKNIRNALFTNAKTVSVNAMNRFSGVYTNAREGINTVKPVIVATGIKTLNGISSVIRNVMNAPALIIPLESILEPPFKPKRELSLRKMDRIESENL